ncbi:MAG: hypothetical protein DU480_13695 [Nitrosomonas sp.]|uniref:phage tail protein n=1 Tax=Nitrosomonas sp. TaxID=42353 RepID=UPI0032EF8B27
MKHHEIKQLLPEVLKRTDQAGSPLYGILEVMEILTEPIENSLNNLPRYFNPYTTPEEFLPFLAGWVDLDRFFIPFHYQSTTMPEYLQTIESDRLRELIVTATQLSKLRGTTSGLQSFLEIATGLNGFEVEEMVSDNKIDPIPFHIRINAPKAAKIYHSLIERIIEQEKPAYVTYTLVYKLQ